MADGDLLKPDICVIGAGAAGLSVAAGAALFGVQVVLVEKGEMGGDCLNYGCVPSKALIASAKHAQMMRDGAPFGVAPVEPTVDFTQVMRHVDDVIKSIAPIDSVERFRALGVDVIQAEAAFVDRRTLVADGKRIQARRFVVASGSTPFVPPIPGLDSVAFHTNETIFKLRKAADHLLVLGGGPIGIELAQAFRRLGSKVTVIEADKALGREDRELAEITLGHLVRDGVDIREGVRVVKVGNKSRKIQLTLEGTDGTETVLGSHLLVATGRRPTVDGLGLDKAGVRHSERGIQVDRGLKTSNRKIYAIGDCIGGLQFTHVANYHAGLVLRNALFRMPVKVCEDHLPRVTYTDPEIAVVGLTEDQARKRHRDVEVLRWPLAENDRAHADRVGPGLIKIVADRKGRVLGAGIVAPHAGEIIHAWGLPVQKRMKLSAITGLVVAYPTLAEIGKRAATNHFLPSLNNPWLRRIIRWLRRLG